MRDLLRFSNLLINHHHHHHNQTELRANNATVQTFLMIRDITIAQIVVFGLGHVLGYYHKSEYERFYFRHKSIYQRKYHYQNKIKEVRDKFQLVLSEEEQYRLYKKLMEIND